MPRAHPLLQSAGIALLTAAVGCGSSSGPAPERDPAEQPRITALPIIELPTADGVEPGTPVIMRGVPVGEVKSLRVVSDAVEVTASLSGAHEIVLGSGACVWIDGRPRRLMLESGGEQGHPPDPLPACPGFDAEDARPATADDPQGEPDLDAPSVPDEPTAKPKKGKKRRGPKPSCGPDISFGTSTSKEIAPIPLHLPDGGWRVKIDWKNSGPHHVEISGSHRASFVNGSGRVLNRVDLPSYDDWFFGFELPPHSTKSVWVTFDEADRPVVERISYDYSCD